MTFPFEWLSAEGRQVGHVAGVAIGFAFGFVLERAGFGRAQKLVGQFYGNDMTVFKVMFGAIVTAMLGAVVLSGLGLMDLRAVASSVTSATYLWPMIVGGFVLGAGFIVSGYCPGTSVVAAASGKLDGLATVGGVVLGTLVYGELLSWDAFAAFTESGYLGQIYLYDLLGLPAPVVALFVAAMAVGCFIGAEKLERIFAKEAAPPSPLPPKRLVFAGFGAFAVVGLATLALPSATQATPAPPARMAAADLARRVVEAPWNVRVLDLRALDACARERVPGAECAPPGTLKDLYLGDVSPARDLVVVAEGDLADVPAEIRAYRGEVRLLEGGFAAWRAYALAEAPPPAAGAPAAEVESYQLRAGLRAALTGVKAAPPPAPAAGGAPVKRKAGGGGCSG